MKILLLLILFVGITIPTTLSAARFDWVLGEPVVVEDLDNTTHGTRYDWVLGQPTIIREAETVAAPSDTCTAPTTGNWTVNLGDDCYVTINTYVAGNLILIDNTGTGCLNIIDGAILSVDGWEATSTRPYICLESDDGSKIQINNTRS